MTITDRIDSLIRKRGLSRRQLAIAAGIPPSSLQSAMARGRNITFDMLQCIAEALEVPVQALMGYDVIGKTPEGIDLYGVPGEYIAFENDYSDKAVLQIISLLNAQGRIKTMEYAKDLSEIPRYRAQERPQASPADSAGQDTTPALEGAEGPYNQAEPIVQKEGGEEG